MLPKFPEFKKLELSDRADIEAITSKYPPYSDFEFNNMWAWNFDNLMEVSLLNGNLVITPSDYFTKGRHLSYLGNNKSNQTLQTILEFVKNNEDFANELKFVPEVSLRGVDFQNYIIEIDIDNCDYIYDVGNLANYPNHSYSKKRYKVTTFNKNYPRAKFIEIDLSQSLSKEHILELNECWYKHRHVNDESFHYQSDLKALSCLLGSDFANILCFGVAIGDKLIGFSIFHVIDKDNILCHFFKADLNHDGVYEYMMKNCAQLFHSQSYKFINFQEDLGLPGLRFYKSSFRPSSFLRKYKIS